MRQMYGIVKSVTLATALGLAMAAGGCQTGGGGGGGAASSEPYMQSYERGQYQQALAQASASAGQGGADGQRAALVAGMSASALGKQGDAARWLTPLTKSGDDGIAGRAAWTLGSMAESQGRQDDAADWYLEAAEKLSGDDAARAGLAAGDAMRRTNDSRADGAYALAARKADDASLKATIESRRGGDAQAASATAATMSRMGMRGGMAMGGSSGSGSMGLCTTIKAVSTGTSVASVNVIGSPSGSSSAAVSGPFTVQFGAFSDQSRAGQQLRAAQAAARKAGAPMPALVPITDANGRSLFAVRMGTYSTMREANGQLSKVGLQGVVVAAR